MKISTTFAIIGAALLAGALVTPGFGQGGLGNPDLLATVAKVMVWGFAIVVAVNQIGVAQTLVNALFIAVVGAAAIALGLAFGIGGKDTAAKIVQDWYATSQNASRRFDRVAESGSRMQQAAGNPQGDPSKRQF